MTRVKLSFDLNEVGGICRMGKVAISKCPNGDESGAVLLSPSATSRYQNVQMKTLNPSIHGTLEDRTPNGETGESGMPRERRACRVHVEKETRNGRAAKGNFGEL